MVECCLTRGGFHHEKSRVNGAIGHEIPSGYRYQLYMEIDGAFFEVSNVWPNKRDHDTDQKIS